MRLDDQPCTRHSAFLYSQIATPSLGPGLLLPTMIPTDWTPAGLPPYLPVIGPVQKVHTVCAATPSLLPQSFFFFFLMVQKATRETCVTNRNSVKRILQTFEAAGLLERELIVSLCRPEPCSLCIPAERLTTGPKPLTRVMDGQLNSCSCCRRPFPGG